MRVIAAIPSFLFHLLCGLSIRRLARPRQNTFRENSDRVCVCALTHCFPSARFFRRNLLGFNWERVIGPYETKRQPNCNLKSWFYRDEISIIFALHAIKENQAYPTFHTFVT